MSGYRVTAKTILLLVGLSAITNVFGQTPELSGVWQSLWGGRGGPRYPTLASPALVNEEPPLTQWGQDRFALAKPIHGPNPASATESNAAELLCLPMGMPHAYFRPRPFEIIQLPDRVVMLFETDNFWRVIYTDGREFPEIPLHTWNGYSIGRYEGDTLVIETRYFVGWESEQQQRWLDRLGWPHSDELRLIERIRRIDEQTLENKITIDDPIAYEMPWNSSITFTSRDFELAEFICQELMLSELPEMKPER